MRIMYMKYRISVYYRRTNYYNYHIMLCNSSIYYNIIKYYNLCVVNNILTIGTV